MGREGKPYKHGKKNKDYNRKGREQGFQEQQTTSQKNVPEKGGGKSQRSFKHQEIQDESMSHSSIVRKQVDPETAKYFTEIANLFESNRVDLEERSVICGNAIAETKGKEYELATDYIISHFLQTLLEGCDVENLCGFLRSSAPVFTSIAMDRSGSHVAETALKSLATHLQDPEVYSTIKETLTVLCERVVENPLDIMCNCHGSHVLRRLLCLCKGVSLDSPDFHGKSSTALAQRLNLGGSQSDPNDIHSFGGGFPDLLKFIVSELVKHSSANIRNLLVNQFGSLVLQTALKLLAGDEDLVQIILNLLGCNKEDIEKGNLAGSGLRQNVLNLLKENSYSHLMEVILEVAPTDLYSKMFNNIFKNSLFELSSDQSGSFVVQAVLSHARNKDQFEMIWEELGTKFRDLLVMGRSGVIASLIASSHKLSSHEHKCCHALAAAVASTDGPSATIVPRLLFLDSFIGSEDKASWEWPSRGRMHVLGSLILQTVFKFRSEFTQPFITSITSLEVNHVLEAAKDSRGIHVIEAFLISDTAWKLKRKLITKLLGHFGEISMQSSGSFIVEKCFNASNASLKKSIVSELLAVRNELSKTKHGPHLIRRLDVDGYGARPDQWMKRQESKQSTYDEFRALFGSDDFKSQKGNNFSADTFKKAPLPTDVKQMRKEIDQMFTSATPYNHKQSLKRDRDSREDQSNKRSKQGKKRSG